MTEDDKTLYRAAAGAFRLCRLRSSDRAVDCYMAAYRAVAKLAPDLMEDEVHAITQRAIDYASLNHSNWFWVSREEWKAEGGARGARPITSRP